MKKVIVIREDNHGVIGVASTVFSALMFLVETEWLNSQFDYYDEKTDSFKPIIEVFGESWEQTLVEIETIDEFNEFFDGSFHLEEFELFEKEA